MDYEREVKWPTNLRVGGSGRIIKPPEPIDPRILIAVGVFFAFVVLIKLVQFFIEEVLIPIVPIFQMMVLVFAGTVMLALLLLLLLWLNEKRPRRQGTPPFIQRQSFRSLKGGKP